MIHGKYGERAHTHRCALVSVFETLKFCTMVRVWFARSRSARLQTKQPFKVNLLAIHQVFFFSIADCRTE